MSSRPQPNPYSSYGTAVTYVAQVRVSVRWLLESTRQSTACIINSAPCQCLCAEGYEHDVIPAWNSADDLPDELSIEVHAKFGHSSPGTVAELGLTFLHLANLGYAAYSQEVNSWGPECCAEFSFINLGQYTAGAV